MEDAKLAILTDAKQEYSSQLINILKISIYNGIKHLYDEAKKKCMSENRSDEVLVDFQDFLSQIRLWSQEMVEQEYKRIEKESECDFIKELITAVFMSHMQILQVIGSGSKKHTQIDIPKPEHFIHKCYINAGREFYKNPMFFYDGPEVSPIERHRNIPHSETVIATTINETIRQLLPIRRILKSSLQDTEIEEPKVTVPVVNDPVVTDTVVTDTVVTDTVVTDPVVTDIVVTDTVVTDTVVTDTVVTDTVVADTVVADTVVTDPVVTDTVVADTVVADTVVSEPLTEAEIEQYTEINDDEREEIFIEDVPELSINQIEDIISKQEYVLPVEKKDEENENIKKNIIADLDFQEVGDEKEPEPKSLTNINLEIKSVEMDNDDKQKTKKQKQEEQEIIIQKQDVDVNLNLEPLEKEKEKETKKEKETEIVSEELTIDTNFEFDEEIDLNDGPIDIDSANISLPTTTTTTTTTETTSQPGFKPTTTHKFKFF